MTIYRVLWLVCAPSRLILLTPLPDFPGMTKTRADLIHYSVTRL
jgi:hypothetical protein